MISDKQLQQLINEISAGSPEKLPAIPKTFSDNPCDITGRLQLYCCPLDTDFEKLMQQEIENAVNDPDLFRE